MSLRCLSPNLLRKVVRASKTLKRMTKTQYLLGETALLSAIQSPFASGHTHVPSSSKAYTCISKYVVFPKLLLTCSENPSIRRSTGYYTGVMQIPGGVAFEDGIKATAKICRGPHVKRSRTLQCYTLILDQVGRHLKSFKSTKELFQVLKDVATSISL